jgi:hypothetical protein
VDSDASAASAILAWTRLPARTRREVHAYAQQGRLHPDPVVSRTSVDWAQVIVARAERRRHAAHWVSVGFAVLLTALAAGLDVVTNSNGSLVGDAISAGRDRPGPVERRRARRIIAACEGAAQRH